MVTPLRGRDELDLAGLERLIDRILDGGVDGLFILGTTGEGPSLSYRLRRELIERVCRQVRGRVPVLVGITDSAFVESVSLAQHAASLGADALVVAPPFYFPEGQPELQEYLEHLVAQLPLPLFLYNMPSHTKVQFGMETLRRAMAMPGVIGLKDSSGAMQYFRESVELAKGRADWTVLIGPEELLAEAIASGGNGGVSGGANLFPALYVQLCRAALNGDVARAKQLQDQVIRISNSLYRVGHHGSAIIKGIKCALACLGVCDDFMAEPFHRFRAEERARVQEQLAELKNEVETVLTCHAASGSSRGGRAPSRAPIHE
jgi:dihydrodipicolinate synthase/N-acetylneuraminate lyase